MNMIMTTVLQEKKTIEYMLSQYQEKLSTLPKGSIAEKKVKDRTYYYLKYRDGKKVVSQYVPKTKIEEVRKQIEYRKHIESMIKTLQSEVSFANKILEDTL